MANNKFPIEDVLVQGSSYPRHRLKARLVKEGLLEYSCKTCQNAGNWNGARLVLQLEHLNGVSNDNRIENLAFLCPNCHSQTPTYAGRNSTGMRCGEPKPNPRSIKLIRDKALWAQIQSEGLIDFTKWGWRVKLANRIGITSQKVQKWLDRIK